MVSPVLRQGLPLCFTSYEAHVAGQAHHGYNNSYYDGALGEAALPDSAKNRVNVF
jgi:hypothetical protein